MNIIFVINFDLYKRFTKIKSVGGIETNTNDVIKELKQRGHNVWVPERQREEPEWVRNGEVDIITASTFDPLTYLQVENTKSVLKRELLLYDMHIQR